jgi:predicted enzyme related to lactoylglutathione lyase
MIDGPTDEPLRDLLGKGLAGTVFLTTDDCRRTYEDMKARGVEFIGEPEEQMYGIDVGFRDPSGNNVRLRQLNADFG